MNESKIAVRYAKALFLSANESKVLESVKTDMYLISEVLKENELFRGFLYSPVTKPSALRKVINTAFGDGKIEPLTLNFMGLLIQNNRIQYLQQTALVFFTIYRKHKGIKSATLSTVSELNDTFKVKFQQVLKDIYKAEIDLAIIQKPDIIGGFVLKVDDQQYDASIATRLKNMRAALLAENLK
jgi:F-type H+-transporting ATPase subunit delta